MAQDRPEAGVLLSAVRELIERDLLPEAPPGRAFHLRVAANLLQIVERELALAPDLDREEQERLVALLGHEGDLLTLNRELCAGIRDGSLDAMHTQVTQHLWATTKAKLQIANPRYR